MLSVNVGDAFHEVNLNALHASDAADDFLNVRLAVVACHLLNIVYGNVGNRISLFNILLFPFLFALLSPQHQRMAQAVDKGVGKQKEENGHPHPVHRTKTMGTVTAAHYHTAYFEPLLRQ